METTIKADLYRYGGLSGKKGFFKVLFISGFRYTYLLRKAYKRRKYSFMWIIYNLLLRKYSFKYGFQIPSRTQIGEGFFISHFGNVVIHPEAKIGKNFNISPSTTIGKANRGDRKGYPTISDNVWIGTGSVIVGNIQIGNNVLIAPCSYVNFDIPCNSIVLGNPAKIIEKENATEGYINYILNE